MKNVTFKREVRCFFQPSSSSIEKCHSRWLALMLLQCEARIRGQRIYTLLFQKTSLGQLRKRGDLCNAVRKIVTPCLANEKCFERTRQKACELIVDEYNIP